MYDKTFDQINKIADNVSCAYYIIINKQLKIVTRLRMEGPSQRWLFQQSPILGQTM